MTQGLLRLYLLLGFSVLLCAGDPCSAQPNGGPNSPIAPNIVLTDIDGVQHDMYSYLDQGKTVVVEFWASWCDPCYNSFAGAGMLWDARGPNGNNTVMIFGVEIDATTWFEVDIRNNYNIEYPVFNNGQDIIADWNPILLPTFAVVCPDRSWHLVEQDIANIPSYLTNWIDQCAPPGTQLNDVRAIDYRGSTSLCGEGNWTPVVRFQNLGANALTSCTIETYVNGSLVQTAPWTGNLTQNQIADSVQLPMLTGLGSAFNAEFVFTQVNGSADADPANNTIGAVVGSTVPGTAITFELKFDEWTYETAWALLDSQGDTVHQHGWYDPAFFPPFSTITETWTLNTLECYRFEIYDYNGDGICCGAGNGFYKLRDGNNVVFHQGGTFAFMDAHGFIPDAAFSVNDADPGVMFHISPNPTSGLVFLDWDTDAPVHLEILDPVGRLIKAWDLPPATRRHAIDISELSGGTYLVSVRAEGGTAVQRIQLTDE